MFIFWFRKRDSSLKESSPEKHLDESLQDNALLKRNHIEKRYKDKI